MNRTSPVARPGAQKSRLGVGTEATKRRTGAGRELDSMMPDTADSDQHRPSAASLREHVENFRRRVLQDALLEAEAAYWLRRAEAFEAARPRPGEYVGQATPLELAARDDRLVTTALACRRRAQLALLQTGSDHQATIDAALTADQLDVSEQVAS